MLVVASIDYFAPANVQDLVEGCGAHGYGLEDPQAMHLINLIAGNPLSAELVRIYVRPCNHGDGISRSPQDARGDGSTEPSTNDGDRCLVGRRGLGSSVGGLYLRRGRTFPWHINFLNGPAAYRLVRQK